MEDLRCVHGEPARYTELVAELIDRWEDLRQAHSCSRVMLVSVPAGWGCSTVLDRVEAEITSQDDAPVASTIRINCQLLPDLASLQAQMLRSLLAAVTGRHRTAALLGLDRPAGTAQLALGVGGLFFSGLAAGLAFLVAGLSAGAAGKAWDDSPGGQDGALARAARAVAAMSTSAPVAVIIDDADCLDLDLAVTLIENLTARHNSQVMVFTAVNPGSALAATLASRARYGLTEGLVHTARADPDMGYQSRLELARQLRPHLPPAATRRIAQRAGTFAGVFKISTASRLDELDSDQAETDLLAATDAVIGAQLTWPAPSKEAVAIAWAGGLLHARQITRALSILAATRSDHDEDVHRSGSLSRLADPASPRLAEQVAALGARDRRAMAAAVLDEALIVAAAPDESLVDRVVALQAAHRVRADLADPDRLLPAQLELAAGLEAIGDRAAALQVATQALMELPATGRAGRGRVQLAAAVLRLSRAAPDPSRGPLVERLVTEALAGGAATGLEARIWAAIDLLDTPARRHVALALIDQVAAELEGSSDLGPYGDQWRLLLAFHAGRTGQPAVSERLLGPMLRSADTAQQDAASAVLRTATGPGADIRLQNILLEAELAARPGEDNELRIHHGLAANHAALGDYRQALIHGRRELALLKRLEPPDRPATLAVRSNIADWTGQCGNARRALRLYRELLPDQERVLGVRARETLATRGNAAYWTGEGGDPGTALRLYRELLPDQEQALGRRHPDLLATRANIAAWTGRCGDIRASLRLYGQLLPDQEQILGRRNPDTMACRNNIALLTGRCVNVAAALRLLRELLPDREQILGPDHPGTLVTRLNIAHLTARAGQPARALRLYQELLSDLEHSLGPHHSLTVDARRDLTALTSRQRTAH